MTFILSALWHLLPLWAWIIAVLMIGGGIAMAILNPAVWASWFAAAVKLLGLIPWSKWQTWVVLGLIVGAIGGKFWLGYHDAKLVADTNAGWQAKEDKARADRTEQISSLVGALSTTQQALATERAIHQTDLQTQKADYEKRLHDYVPSGTSCLRAGFVRYTDAAAAGVPLPAGPQPGLASAPSGVGDDVEAGIIARNYAKYHACEARVADLLTERDAVREMFNKQVAAINKQVK